MTIPNNIEAWVPIANTRYEVSTYGNVRSFHHSAKKSPKIRILKPRGRYKSLTLYGYKSKPKTEVRVHALVAETFHGPRPPENDVHHVNWDKDDNSWNNLEYLPHDEHMRLQRG